MKTIAQNFIGGSDGAARDPAATSRRPATVLRYVGYTSDAGGILAVIRTLEATRCFRTILGVSPGFQQTGTPSLRLWRGPRVSGERIGFLNAVRCLGVAWRVRRWLRRGGGRVFHGHSRAGLLVALWLWLLGETRVVASVHCLGRQRWFYRMAARLLGARLVWLGPAMKEHYGLFDQTSWSNCIPDCVQLETALPGADRRQHEPGLHVGCVGALVAIKQWELVLRALAELPVGSSVALVHAGGEDGSAESTAYAAHLRQVAAELGIETRVEWCGPVRDMRWFYSRVDVLVVASRWEASSVAALEAAAAGVPVIAPNAGGTRDLVRTAHAGWLFRADDATDLAKLLGRLAGEDARQTFQIGREEMNRFAAPVVAEQWERLYGELTDASA